MFEEQLAECRDLAAQARQELQKLASASAGEKSSICDGARALLKNADQGLQTLEMEARSAPTAQRASLKSAEDSVRLELRQVAEELAMAKKVCLLGAPASGAPAGKGGGRGGGAGGYGGNNDLFQDREERRRAQGVTANLDKQTQMLKEAHRQAIECEQFGSEALQELHRQGEVIRGTKDRVGELSANNNEAKRIVKQLDKPWFQFW